MGAVDTYFAAASGVQAQLDAFVAVIEDINDQEIAFEWDITTYPMKTRVGNQLEPFLKLYKSIVDFDQNKESWLNGNYIECARGLEYSAHAAASTVACTCTCASPGVPASTAAASVVASTAARVCACLHPVELWCRLVLRGQPRNGGRIR